MLSERSLASLKVTAKVDPRRHGWVYVPELVSDANDGNACLMEQRGNRSPEGVWNGPAKACAVQNCSNRGR